MRNKQKNISLYEQIYKSYLVRLSQATLYLDKNSQKNIKHAFKFAAQFYGSKKRLNGEFLITHSTEVCLILAEIKIDQDSLIAALLHDLDVEQVEIRKQVLKNYGSEVLFLVQQVRLLVQRLRLTSYKENDSNAEYLRQMFMATTQDLRAVILKLADRTHDLQSLEGFGPEKSLQIAKESLYIDAHIAARLNIYIFKNKLENLAFRHTHPGVYYFMEDCHELNMNNRCKIADQLIIKTEYILNSHNIKYTKVKGRAKTYYSTFNKLKLKRGDINKVYDLIALRVVAKSISDCYEILKVLHQEFIPVSGRFKDFISYPKIDGYQSLHTTVKDSLTGLVFEFQIRTTRMDELAEYGPMAHWRYKNQTKIDLVDFLDFEVLKNINQGLELQGNENITKNTNNVLKKSLSLFDDKVFTISVDGEVYRLPKGATVGDYLKLYKPELYRKLYFVRINNKICSINYKINTGDLLDTLNTANFDKHRVKLQLRKY